MYYSQTVTASGGSTTAGNLHKSKLGSKAASSTVRVKVVDNTKKKTPQSEMRDHVLETRTKEERIQAGLDED